MKRALPNKIVLALLTCALVSTAWAQDTAALDFDNSGQIDLTDFILFSEAFGLDAPEGSFGAGFDIDGDGQVFFDDLFLLADNLGRSADEVVFNSKQTGPFANANAALSLTPASVTDAQAGQTLEFDLSGSGLVGVRQVDFTFSLDPPSAFVLNSARLTRNSQTLESSLFSRDSEAGTVRVGGFNSQGQIDGAASFGTFSVQLSDDFNGQAAIHLTSAALGPSSDRQDAFSEDQLNLSLAISSNTPPQLSKNIADLHLSAGLQPYIRDLEANPAVFADEDDDALSYQVSSSSPGVASASVSGSVLTVEAFSKGSTTVTVEADDGSGTTASTSFVVEVDADVPFEIAHIRSDQLPAIDADLDEWQDLFGDPVLSSADFLSTVGEVRGTLPTADQDIEVWLAWNDETNLLYIAARVQDNAYGSTSLSDPLQVWRSDNIEVYLDADNSGGFYSSDNLHAQEYVLNPENKAGAPVLFPLIERDEGRALATDPPFVEGAVRREGTEYVYEMAVPGWNRLEADGTGQRHRFTAQDVIGLALIFADFESQDQADARQHHAHNGLRGPVEAWRDADQLSDFRLQAPANQAPQVSVRPTPLGLTLDDEPVTLDLNAVFSDPDGDALSFSANSANPTVVRAELVSDTESANDKPSLLRLTLLDTGGSLISLTADDGQTTAQVAFTVDVAPGNSPPTVANPPQDVQLVVEGEEEVIDLRQIFTDADGDSLVFTSRISATGRVGTRLSTDGTLTLTPLAPGTLTLTLTASDGRAAVEARFAVEVQPAAASDLDGSGSIDLPDLFAFVAAYGGPGPGGDADGNGRVDNTDFFILAENLGRANAEIEVPDPPAPPDGFAGANAGATFRLVTVQALGKAAQTDLTGISAVDAVSIDKVESGQEVSFALRAEGISQVNQLEITLRLSPPEAFDLSAVAFAENEGFSFSPGVIVGNDGTVEMAAAVLSIEGNEAAPLEGDLSLGTVRLKTTDFFSAGFHADIAVERLALGPRLVEHDIFDDLNLGLRLNNAAPQSIFSDQIKVQIGGEAFELALDQLVEDPDGDALVYAVSIDDPSLARAEIISGANSVTDGPQLDFLRVTPLVAGTTTLNLEASDPYGAQVSARIPLTVRPAPTPVIEVSTAEINFGEVVVGQSGTRFLTVSNRGDADLSISATAGVDAPFRRADTPITLAPDQETELSVGFIPTTASVFRDTLVFLSDDPQRPRVEIALLGAGSATGSLAADELDFGAIEVGQSRIDTLRLLNQKNIDFTYTDVALEPADTPAFSLLEPLERSGVLAAGGVLPIGVRFDPAQAGTAQAVLRWIGIDDSLRVPLAGTGSEPAPDPPAAPTLLAPADGADDQPLSLQLRWGTAQGVQTYEIQLDDDSDFTSAVLERDGLAATTLDAADLESSTAYFWRVRGHNAAGPGAWSAAWTFTTQTPLTRPTIPTAREPENEEKVVALRPTLVWSAVTGAQTYRLQVTRTTRFAGDDLVVDVDDLSDSTYTFGTDLVEGQAYLWRVWAANEAGSSSWSTPRSFTPVRPLEKPGIPVPQAPADGEEVSTLTPALVWFNVEGADSYRVQIAQNNRFTGDDLVEDFDGATDTTFAVLAGLEDGGTYQWRVWAANEAGSSSWSTPRSFAVALPTGPPGIPQPDTPADEETVDTDEPVLRWFAVDGADSYRIQVTSIRNNFGRLGVFEDFEPISDTLYTLKGLESGRSFWWRLYAQNEDGVSAWSDPRGFTLQLAAALPQPPVPDQPADGGTLGVASVELSWGAIEGATTYALEVATNADFSAIFARREGLSDTRVSIEELADGQTYFWRVQALNASGASDWSTARSFAVTLPLQAPAIPQPDTPADGFEVDTLTPALRWFAVNGATGYRLQVGQNSRYTGDDLIEDADALSDTAFTLLQGLVDGQTYQWRVWAANDAGNSSWSAPRSFTVRTPNFDETPPTLPDGISAWADAGRQRGLTDGEWHAVPRPFFEWSGSRDEVSGVAGYAVLLTQNPEDPVSLDEIREQASYSPATDLRETGTYHLLLRVVDAAGNWSEAISLFTYRYDGTAPAIDAAPPSSLTAGRDIELQVEISDAGQMQAAQLHYRIGGAAAFTALDLQAEGDTYRASLSGEAIGPRGLQFYFSATDEAGNAATAPPTGDEAPFAPTVDVPEALAKAPDLFPTNQWRMLSVPLLPSNGAPLNLLRLLGAYDDTRWRLFRYFGGTYREFTREDIGAFAPGRVFWLYSRIANLEFGSGTGRTTDLLAPFEITLEPGWNDIAVPFAFAVAWDEIMRQSGDPTGVVGPYAYDGIDWSLPQGDEILSPWKGYAVNNATSGFIVLQIPPQAADDAGKSTARLNHSGWEDGGWTLRLKALGDASQDTHNYLGVRPDAQTQWDRRDLPEPPSTPDGSVALYFSRPAWDRYPGSYASDFRPDLGEGLVWDLDVRGAGPLRLLAEGLADLPAGLSARLLAPDGRLATTLRPGEPFPLDLDSGGETRRLRLVVGADAYLETQSQNYGSRPAAFALEQSYPNPFNPETEIAFRLPVRARVRLGVYDLLGRPVALLWEGERPAGYHRFTWRGLDDDGRPVSSGIYLYTLETPQGRFTRKMALVR